MSKMDARMPAKTLRTKAKVKQAHRAVRDTMDSGVRLSFLLQDWDDGYNVGAMFRTAEGLGNAELVMTGRTPVPPHPMIGVTSLGQHRRVPFRHFAKHDEAVGQLIDEGWTLVAVEITADAEPFHRADYPERTCLVLGNEGAGIYDSVMRRCTQTVFIPMFGKGRSLNVVVAAAIVGFQAKLRR